MIDAIKAFFRTMSSTGREAEFQRRLADARTRCPVPVFWLFGKTQTGKTSIIKYLTGATEAEIGNGFRPCTRFSREFDFPTAEAPLLTFLDTRGLEEPGYDPAEDIARFDELAHLILVTIKVMDHSHEAIVRDLESIRRARPTRPIVLALTCLHEAYPQQQHPTEYPFLESLYPESAPEGLRRSIAEHHEQFRNLVDDIIPIDLTRPEEGFTNPNFGGEELKQAILRHLPGTYRQTLVALDRETGVIRDAFLKRAMPIILAYSYLAAGAGAIPIPFVDLIILSGIQIKMVMELAELHGQPLTGKRFMEIATTLGLGIMARQAAREVAKFIPFFGSAAGAALAGASTYALGRAFCFYYQTVREGHVPDPNALKQYFEKELAAAERFWSKKPAESETHR